MKKLLALLMIVMAACTPQAAPATSVSTQPGAAMQETAETAEPTDAQTEAQTDAQTEEATSAADATEDATEDAAEAAQPAALLDPEAVCPSGSPTLVIAAGSVGQELELLNASLASYMELCPNVTAEALETGDLVTDRLGLYNQFLASRSAAVDIYSIDVIWPAIVADHMVNFYDYYPADSDFITQHFPSTIENNTVNGRLIGMPWFIDAGMLYYRADLLEKYGLEIPQTWAELEEAARVIQDGERSEGNSQFWGYVWPSNTGEPTTIASLEWQASSGGGSIIDSAGGVNVNNPETIAMIERASAWLGNISPDAVIGHTPSDTAAIWYESNAAFMRNWGFAYTQSEAREELAGNFGVTTLPMGDDNAAQHASVLGGWQLAVSQYSEDIEASVLLVRYLTSYDVQKFRAIQGGYFPTIEALYGDEELQASERLFADAEEIFPTTVARPSSVTRGRYSEVSRLYSDAVHAVLRGQNDARTAMEDLQFDLEDLMADILGQ